MKHFSTFQDKRSAKKIRGEFRSFNPLFVTWLAFWILLDINLSKLSSSYKLKCSLHFCIEWAGLNNLCKPSRSEKRVRSGWMFECQCLSTLDICLVTVCQAPDQSESPVIPWYESLCVMSDGKLPCGAIMSQITHITISGHWPIRGQEGGHQPIRSQGTLGRLKPFLSRREFKVGSWVA